jgi:hypothetical protein
VKQLPRVILYGRLELEKFQALAEGCRAVGWHPMLQRPSQFRFVDAYADALAVVVDGLGLEGRPIAETYRRLGVPVWVLELPRIRQYTGEHALLLDSLHWLPEGVAGRIMPDFPTLKRQTGAKHILLAMQKPGDAAHGMDLDALERWARNTVAFIKAVTGKQVIVRPHPKHKSAMPDDLLGADALSHPNSEPIDAALAKAAAVVSYNSTVGWDAIIAGVPVVALAPAALCSYHRYTTTLAELKPLPAKARTEALARVASTQWTLDELRDGTALMATVAVSHLLAT